MAEILKWCVLFPSLGLGLGLGLAVGIRVSTRLGVLRDDVCVRACAYGCGLISGVYATCGARELCRYQKASCCLVPCHGDRAA